MFGQQTINDSPPMVAKLPVLNTGANDVTNVYKCDTNIYMKYGNAGRKQLTQPWDEISHYAAK
jgi:hypothetical protein